MSNQLRKGLPPLPDRIKALPIDARGYPIPWFVATIDGVRDFRVADGEKRYRAVKEELCWVCGQKLGKYKTFVIGPMCAVNRNTSEPPSHRDCAEFSVQACPFMMLPKAEYRRANLPPGSEMLPEMLDGNPGAQCLWIATDFKTYKVDLHNWLIRIGDPVQTSWWCEGKPATRQQIIDCFDKRLPLLRDMAVAESKEAEAALNRMVRETMKLLPA